MPQNPSAEADTPRNGRRDFLRGALAMPAAIGVSVSAAAWLSGCSREAAVADGFRVLRPQDIPMLEKLVPAAIGSNVPADPAARAEAIRAAVKSWDLLMYDTSPTIRAAFTPLLDLLTMGLTRGPLFGVWKSWDDASEADALAALDDWSRSSTGFMRGAYNGFTTLAAMCWYLEPANQGASGYPGPPRKIVGDAA